MQTAKLQRHKLTVNDYYKIGHAGILKEQERIELIEGEMIDMVPIGSYHAYTIDKLNYLFVKQIDDEALVRIQQPLYLNQYNEPQSDLAIVTHQNYSMNHPRPAETWLIIEVANSSLSYDLDIKVPLYASYVIPEVWVIDINKCLINVFQKPEKNTYQHSISISSGILSPIKIPSLKLDCQTFWD